MGCVKVVNVSVNFFYNGESFAPAYDLDEQWNHVVVSVDTSAHSKIYINTEVETFSINSLDINNNLNIQGEIDDVMLFNRALFETDVNGLYVYQMK